jgi:predicted lactoylglutathione lyase
VSDLGRATAFYEALGWTRATSSNQDICWFHTAGAYLGLFPYQNLAEDANLPATPRSPFGGVTLAINVESEDAVSAAILATQRAGATILKKPVRAPWGGFSGYFADFDGYPWEVAYNPYFPIAEDGAIRIP